jgi:hypothetical protein
MTLIIKEINGIFVNYSDERAPILPAARAVIFLLKFNNLTGGKPPSPPELPS